MAIGENTTTLTKMSRKTRMTFSYVQGTVRFLVYLGIVETNKEGRERKVRLTDKGLNIYRLFLQIADLIGIRIGNRTFF